MKLTTHLHLVPRLMRGAKPPPPHCVFMAWPLVKHKDNFYLCAFNLAPRNEGVWDSGSMALRILWPRH